MLDQRKRVTLCLVKTKNGNTLFIYCTNKLVDKCLCVVTKYLCLCRKARWPEKSPHGVDTCACVPVYLITEQLLLTEFLGVAVAESTAKREIMYYNQCE